MLKFSIASKKTTLLSLNLLIAVFSTQSVSATLDSTLNNKIDSTLFENFQFSKDFLDQSHLKDNNAPSPETIKSLISNGIKLYRTGKHTQGLSELKKAWELAPTMPSTGVTLAMFYIENKQFQKAFEIAKQLKNILPDRSFYSHMIEGFAFIGLNEIENAKKSFELVLKTKPGDPTASQALATLAIKEKNIPQAKKYYLNALTMHPGNLRLIAQLARIDNSPEHRNEINKLIKHAKQSAPNTVATHVQFARLHYFLKNYSQEPSNIFLHSWFAEQLRKQGKLDEAIQEYEKILQQCQWPK